MTTFIKAKLNKLERQTLKNLMLFVKCCDKHPGNQYFKKKLTYLIEHLQGGKIEGCKEWRRITKAETFHANGGIQHVSHLKSGFLKIRICNLNTRDNNTPTDYVYKYSYCYYRLGYIRYLVAPLGQGTTSKGPPGGLALFHDVQCVEIILQLLLTCLLLHHPSRWLGTFP